MWRVKCADFREVLSRYLAEVDSPIIISDPPFNIGYHYSKYRDSVSKPVYMSMLLDAFPVKSVPCVMINYPETIYEFTAICGKAPARVVSWVYNSNTRRQHRDIAFWGVIPDFSKVKQPYKNLNDKRIKERMERGCVGANIYDWWNINQVKNVSKEKTAHPCQMPIEVMQNIIGILPERYTVIDPFCGSGTTGAAAVRGGLDFYGCDVDENYCDIARKRIMEVEHE